MNLSRLMLLAALVLSGCPNDTVDPPVNLEPKMVVAPAALDLGPVAVGTQKSGAIAITNQGTAVLDIEVTEIEAAPNFSFTVDRTEIAPASRATLQVTFTAAAIGAESQKLRISQRNGTPQTVDVTITATGVASIVSVDPIALSFGNVVVGSNRTLVVTVTNTGDLDADIEVAAGDNVRFCTQSSPAEFCFAPTTHVLDAQNRFQLGGNESATFNVVFRPSIAGIRSTGSFTFATCASETCRIEISLEGYGVEAPFRCDPPAIDFGLVSAGSCSTQSVVCENVASDEVTVVDWAIDPNAGSSPDFTVETPMVSVLTLGDSVDIEATYCPTSPGADLGVLSIETDQRDPRLRFFDILLSGSGGGPSLEVTPRSLDFGPVALGAPARRTLTLGNVGFETLVITAIEPGASGSFRIVGTSSASLNPGETVQVTVEFEVATFGAVSEQLIIRSNDPDTPEYAVPLTGEGLINEVCEFEVVPLALDFGSVERARSLAQSFEVRNIGTGECLLSGARLLPGSAVEFSLGTDYRGVMIPAQSAINIPVTFAPTMAGDRTGVVELSMGSIPNPLPQIMLSGSGVEAALLISPDQIDFGVLGIGCNARTRTVTINNVTPDVVTIDSIAAPTNPAFTLFSTPSLPLQLAPGASTQFDVGFHADAAASYASSVVIGATVGGENRAYVIGLEGSGAVDATQVDEFDQLLVPNVDILWIIDDSGSMFEEQQSLSMNFQAFIAFAVAQQLDYQLAVTTTDLDGSPSSEDGRFVQTAGGIRIVTPQSQPSPAAVFSELANQGTNGSGFEQALEAAYLALSNPLVSTFNAGFLRPDAVLSIILVTDEENQSPQTLDFYVNFFLSLKPDPNQVSVSAIVGDPPSGCNGPGGSAGTGAPFIEVASRTGGAFQSICSSDWSLLLEELSTTAFGFKIQFFLSNQPVIQTIEVFVDGVLTPPQGPGGEIYWVYDYSTNSIRFSVFAAPEPGAHIRVEYTVECL